MFVDRGADLLVLFLAMIDSTLKALLPARPTSWKGFLTKTRGINCSDQIGTCVGTRGERCKFTFVYICRIANVLRKTTAVIQLIGSITLSLLQYYETY